MPIDAGDIGSRVVIRSWLPGRHGPSGGPALTDVIGELEAYDGTTAGVVRRDGTRVSVPVTDIVVAKRVPAATGRRISAEDLQRICAEGWLAPVTEPLGDWLLRAAGGFTGRANSALVAGEPGMEIPQALARVTAFYHHHSLPPRAQVVVGSPWVEALESHGWRRGSGSRGGALVMVAALRMAPTAPVAGVSVSVTGRVDHVWLSLYHRAEAHDPAVVRAVLEGPRLVAFARVGDPPIAIGRMAVTGTWAGLSTVEVMAGHRRRGLATAVVGALRDWAVERGARWCYLQVTEDNPAALTMWDRLGFRRHHAYRYFEPTQSAAPARTSPG
ncbi:GNAT family N-acetyltransferase [soil metagenome]